jgi:hypothetical protein
MNAANAKSAQSRDQNAGRDAPYAPMRIPIKPAAEEIKLPVPPLAAMKTPENRRMP